MQLPRALREAVDLELRGVSSAELARAASALSQRYRAETRGGRLYLSDGMAARAYLAARLPATYAAVRAAMAAVADAQREFIPRTMLDVGAGPGTALWAAADCWSGVDHAVLIEQSPAIRAYGEALSVRAAVPHVTWRSDDILSEFRDITKYDLVTIAYVLGELDPEPRDALIERLWTYTGGVLLIVEPGTPAGWGRILRARGILIAGGAYIAAPCPHASPCPLQPPDWCHFARRVARSRLHLRAKSAEVPWEDEKYIYIAAARRRAAPPAARVIAPPHAGRGRVGLKLCRSDGTAEERLVTRRDADAFKVARRLDWGDAMH